MKLRFKHQQFQVDAVNATCEVFNGQVCNEHRFLVDQGVDDSLFSQKSEEGFGNQDIILDEAQLLQNLHQVQRRQNLPINPKIKRLCHKPAFTIEMETGTGKTYTYIKTMYELNKRYGWCKFIVVVPSVAIREGVFKTFQTTADHFAEDYGKKIRFFIYNSARLNELDQFANDSNINVMIINTQAFNARGQDARRISMKLDSFRSRKPIDVIGATRPIVIIDEPQSVIGNDKKSNATREKLAEFRPLFFLNYSATHREDFNKVYRLDAIDAYQQQLVKKIAVKGIETRGGNATSGYLYLQRINTYPNKKPTATVAFEFNATTGTGIRRKVKTLEHGDDIYIHSGEIEAYHDGYTITEINARDEDGFVDFANGLRIHEGQMIGETNLDDMRRIQIRETITTHLETERQLYQRGIKVLSLFFIDEVAKYKYYEDGEEQKGHYAQIFEEEFQKARDLYLEEMLKFGEDAEFREYLEKFNPAEIHAGYFSIDKKGRAVDSAVKRGETSSNDVDAYDLIMKDKERLLSFDEPVRFIFSHSALREGWDNPNVFQICTLRESNAEIKKRQEIGRGLRLCVDNNGNRMDAQVLGEDLVHDTNVLTVIANESYKEFASSLQADLDKIIARRPKDASASLFIGKTLTDDTGDKVENTTVDVAADIYTDLSTAGIIDRETKQPSETYRELPDNQKREQIEAALEDTLKPFAGSIQNLIDSVYDPKRHQLIENARKKEYLHLVPEKYNSPVFRELWDKINDKTYYKVDFDDKELIERCVKALDKNMNVTRREVILTEGQLKSAGKNALKMHRDKIGKPVVLSELVAENVQYDLLDELAKARSDNGTNLTRAAVAEILSKIQPETFHKFQTNPEEFLHNAIKIINEQKSEVITDHIVYSKSGDKWAAKDIFEENDIAGEYGKNLIDTPERHIYDKLRYDSEIEKTFAEELEKQEGVELYVKLPKQYFINTPMGRYNPDWAIAFKDNSGVKHIYFVTETKGTPHERLEIELRGVEKAKIACARKHFATISDGDYIYEVCCSYEELIRLINQ